MQSLKSEIKTFCLGQAFSSAAVLFAAGSSGQRYLFPHSTVMIHPPHAEIFGKPREIKLDLGRLKSFESHIWSALAKHTKQKKSFLMKECQEDKYFTATEAVKYGLADSIISSSF